MRSLWLGKLSFKVAFPTLHNADIESFPFGDFCMSGITMQVMQTTPHLTVLIITTNQKRRMSNGGAYNQPRCSFQLTFFLVNLSHTVSFSPNVHDSCALIGLMQFRWCDHLKSALISQWDNFKDLILALGLFLSNNIKEKSNPLGLIAPNVFPLLSGRPHSPLRFALKTQYKLYFTPYN